MILCTLIKWYQTPLMLAAKHGKIANVVNLIEVAITVNMKLFIVIIIFFMRKLTLHPIIISGGIDCTLNDKTVLLKSAYLCYPTLYFQWISLWPTINRLGYERLT
ncbi:unnamed protein product [Lactuca virosa]|uniref:Uncharacterized protein n=1 Tax=Lactuca virosa TaxID=75947 RepID=A0AAU9MWR0_9ASTR|nr:unnamed protein product [Lactuca virosa]